VNWLWRSHLRGVTQSEDCAGSLRFKTIMIWISVACVCACISPSSPAAACVAAGLPKYQISDTFELTLLVASDSLLSPFEHLTISVTVTVWHSVQVVMHCMQHNTFECSHY